MTHVKVTYQGQTYYLLKQLDGGWLFTYREVSPLGELPFTITLSTSGGNVIVNTDDERLSMAITDMTKTGNSVRGTYMKEYHAWSIKILLEYQILMVAMGFEIDFLNANINMIVDDAYLITMGAERIVQWEEFLGITPQDDFTWEDRREAIIARFRASYKLNTETINSIVSVFTGGAAESYLHDSTLYVYVLVPPSNKQYKFVSVENELKRRVPAHIGLVVKRAYATWGDIKENFDSWNDVKTSLADWDYVKLYLAP